MSRQPVALITLFTFLNTMLCTVAFAESCTISSDPASACAFKVQAVITNGCLTNVGSPISFGLLDFGSHPSLSTETISTSLTGNAAIKLRCTPGMTLSIEINGGSHYGSSRNVAYSGNLLAYRLYSDANRYDPIGVDVPMNISIGSDGQEVVLPVYGEITLPGGARPGIYSDTLTVTLTW